MLASVQMSCTISEMVLPILNVMFLLNYFAHLKRCCSFFEDVMALLVIKKQFLCLQHKLSYIL